MTKHLRFSLVFVAVVLVNGVTLRAQGTGRFNRVSTAGVQRNAAYSSARVTSTARVANTGRSSGNRANQESAIGADSRHPYSGQSLAQKQESNTGVPRFSTSQESAVVMPEPIPQTPPRTYFPGMRSARAIQQPVTLTARATGMPHICTPSRSQMMGSGHHR